MRTTQFIGVSVGWIPLAFLSDGVTVLVLPVVLGANASAIGLTSFVGLGLGVVVQIAAGVGTDRLRDRIGRRVFLTLAAVPVVFGLAALGGGLAPVVAFLVVQVGANAVQAAQQTLVPEAVAGESHGRAGGWKTAFDVGGSFVAFASLGAILEFGGPAAATAVIMLVLVGAIAVMWLTAGRDARPAVDLHVPRSGLTQLVVARFLFLFGTYAVGRFLLLLVQDRDAGAAAATGALLAAFTLLTAFVAIPAGRFADRVGRDRVMAVGAACGAAGIAALIPDLGLPGIAAGGILMSIGTATFMSANWAATTSIVERASAGRTMALANLGTGLAAATAGLLGPLIDAVGFGPPLAVAAVASLAAIIPIVIAALPKLAIGQAA